jgi:CobQ-like glutamine amidotransferase family enzyme
MVYVTNCILGKYGDEHTGQVVQGVGLVDGDSVHEIDVFGEVIGRL